MAEIRIQAVLDRAKFDAEIQNLEKQLKAIEEKPIKIGIDVTGLQSGTAELGKLATANAKVENAAAKSATAQARIAEANARVAVSANQLAVAQERTAQAHERTEQTAIRAGAAEAKAAKEAEDATKAVEQATMRYGETLSAMAVRGAWRMITNEIRESLAAMKEVDKELVTIRKVTGFGQEKISAIGQSAYTVASQYGVLPQDYLESVSNFARAGYKDVSTTLGELAVKTQLVGDVSASTANSMLLAVDAAYKFGGSADKLNAVLDGMNEIDNNFATSIDKISSGIGKVTSIAAQAGVGIDELSAAIGTITAVTQRSGTEAATALRALFLNIMGDTKTEIEDGAKWTAGEIEGLRDVLAHYAPEVINAAAATGQLINPMEAIGALSKAMQEGLLTEQELMQMVSDIGGKLRSSQLLALVQNWDMYGAQLDAFRNSAGSAGEEVARMLDSWEVKANQLDASWMKLVSDVLDTSFIKGTLDFFRGVTELLDFNGGLPAKFVAVAAGISAVSLAFKTLQASTSANAFLSLLTNPYSLALAGTVVAISEIVKALEAANPSQSDLEDKAKKCADEYDRQKGTLESINAQITSNKKLMDEIISKGADATAEEQARLGTLKEQTEELLRQKKIQEYKTEKAGLDAAVSAATAMNGRGYYSQFGYDIFSSNNLVDAKGQGLTFVPGAGLTTTRVGENSNINELLAYYGQLINGQELLNTKIETAPDNNAVLEEYGEQSQWYVDEIARIEGFINDYISESADNAKSIKDYIDTYLVDVPYEKMTSDQKMLVDTYKRYIETSKQIDEFMGVTTGTEASGTSVGSTGGYREPRGLSDWTIANDQHAAQVQALNRAIREFNENGYVSTGTAERMAAAGYDLSDSMVKADLGYVTTAADLRKLSEETAAWYEKFGVQMPESMESIGTEAEQASLTLAELASNALTLQDNAYGAAKALKDLQDGLKGTGEKGDTFKALQQEYADVMKLIGEGRWNSNEVRGFIDMIFGPDVVRANGGYKGVAEWMGGEEFFKKLFTEDSLKTLERFAKEIGEVRDENDNLIASFTKNKDGTFDVVVNDMDALSEKLHVNKDVLAAFFDDLSAYGEIADYSGVTDLVNGMSEGVKELADGTQKVNLGSFIQQLVEAGQSSTKIRELINVLRESDKFVIDGDFGKVGEMIKECEKAKAAKDALNESANTPVVVETDTTEVGESEAKIAELRDQVNKFNMDETQLNVESDDGEVEESEQEVLTLRDQVNKFNMDETQLNVDADSGEVKGAESEIDTLREQVNKYNMDETQLNVGSDSTQVAESSAEIEELESDVDTFNGEDKTVEVGGKSPGLSKVQEALQGLKSAIPTEPLKVETRHVGDGAGIFNGIADAIKRLVPKTIDVVVNYKTTGSPPSYGETYAGPSKSGSPSGYHPLSSVPGADLPVMQKYKINASGTDFYEGGPTLVNERGPELIASKGRAFVANGGRPTIVNLDRGAIIYNADETRELLVGGGISSYGIASRADGDKEKDMAATALAISKIGKTGGDGGSGGNGGGKSPSKAKTSKEEWWKIVEDHYQYALDSARDKISQIELKITHIKNEIADAKRPLEEQIAAYEKQNKAIDRQIQLLNRAKERMTKPIQDEIDALRAQKDIQDEQLALEEKQKAVEEARAALQNAQQERTIRFYNQETGHWEWMADQRAIDDAQKNLDSAEKALADQEFNMRISALEREKDAIEKEFDEQIDELNEQKTLNEDAIYALNEAIDAIDEAYAPELNALEREKELMDRELADTEAEWAHLQFTRQEKPSGNLKKAASKLGKKGATAKEIIDSLKGSIGDIEAAAASGDLDSLTASIASNLIYGSPVNLTDATATGISRGGNSDSHDIIINGLAVTNQGAYDSFSDGLAALGIYAGD